MVATAGEAKPPQRGLTDIMEGLKKAANTIGTGIVVIGWIIAGVLFLTSSGDPHKLGIARTAVIACLIGTIIIIIANSAELIVRGLIGWGG